MDVCTLTRKHSERSAFSQCQKETVPTLCNGGFAEGSARGVVRTALLGVSCILAVDPRLTFNQNQSLGTPSGPHSHSCKIQVWWGLWGNTGLPHPVGGAFPEAPKPGATHCSLVCISSMRSVKRTSRFLSQKPLTS